MVKLPEVAKRAREISDQLAQAEPMRRGSLTERFVKCGKPGCACAQGVEARHGPYHSWTRKVGGRTQSKFLTRQQAELVRRQIEAGQTLRKDVEAVWEACEEWADVELEGVMAVSPETAEKGGSRRSSHRSSSPKSKRS